jgi:hypothetical protein
LKTIGAHANRCTKKRFEISPKPLFFMDTVKVRFLNSRERQAKKRAALYPVFCHP